MTQKTAAFLSDSNRLRGFLIAGTTLTISCAVELAADVDYAVEGGTPLWPRATYAISTAVILLACAGLTTVYARLVSGFSDSPRFVAVCYALISSTLMIGCLILWAPILFFAVTFEPRFRGPWPEALYVTTTACFNWGASCFCVFAFLHLRSIEPCKVSCAKASLWWMVSCAFWFTLGCTFEIAADARYAKEGGKWPDWFYIASTSGFLFGASLFGLLNWDAHRATTVKPPPITLTATMI